MSTEYTVQDVREYLQREAVALDAAHSFLCRNNSHLLMIDNFQATLFERIKVVRTILQRIDNDLSDDTSGCP